MLQRETPLPDPQHRRGCHPPLFACGGPTYDPVNESHPYHLLEQTLVGSTVLAWSADAV